MKKSLLKKLILPIFAIIPITSHAQMPPHGTIPESNGNMPVSQVNRYSSAQPYARINVALNMGIGPLTTPYDEEYLEISAPNSVPILVDMASDCTRWAPVRGFDCFVNYPLSTTDMVSSSNTVFVRYYAKQPGFEAYQSKIKLIAGTAGTTGTAGTAAASCHSQTNPMMPTTTTSGGGFSFLFPQGSNCPGVFFIDPPVSTGFDYSVTGTQFSEVKMPSLSVINDTDGYTLKYFGHNGNPQSVALAAGQNHVFPAPVSDFQLRDINPALNLDPADQTAFPTGIALQRTTQSVTVIQTPITTNVSTNSAPTAVSGHFIEARGQSNFVLNGSQSSDPDGDSLTYEWTQISGPILSMVNANSATATVSLPPAAGVGDAAVFELAVSDGTLTSRPDQVIVEIR